MYTLRQFGPAVVFFAATTCALPAWGQSWSMDFDDGSTGNLIEYDPKEAATGGLINEFTPSVDQGALKLDFNAIPTGQGDDNDSGLMIMPLPFPNNLSGKVLVRYSLNPNLAADPTGSEMNAGFLFSVNLQQLNAYICVMDDRGSLQLQKLTQGAVDDLCPLDSTYRLPDFDPTKDYWIRFEIVPEGTKNLSVRARAWVDGTVEPCEWMAHCVDSDPLAPGVTALLANEDSDTGEFIHVDNASVSTQLSCIEVCGNGTDDDGDGRPDCEDADCEQAPGCGCNDPFADIDNDGDVDQSDFGRWQLCYTGAGQLWQDPVCDCFDRDDVNNNNQYGRISDGDGDLDLDDFAAFQVCLSGPNVPAAKNCDN